MAPTPTVSIVMPAYGVEDYIGKAIACVQAQTLTDWELIVVDDASPDQSAAIAQKRAETDTRIKIVHHTHNQGLSAARNTGIDHASGRYLWLPDPDDTYDADLLQSCVRALEDHHAEVVVFGVCEAYYDQDGSFSYEHKIKPHPGNYDTPQAVHGRLLQLEQETCYGYAWNKIYRRDLLERSHVRFRDVKLIEDISFNVSVFDHVSRMVVLESTPYRYARRIAGNLTNKFLPDYFPLHEQRIQLLLDQQKRWGTLDDTARGILGGLYARYVLSAAERNCGPQAHMTHADRVTWIRMVMESDLYKELIPSAHAAQSKALSQAIRTLQSRKAWRILTLARVTHIVRSNFLPLFTKIKSGR